MNDRHCQLADSLRLSDKFNRFQSIIGYSFNEFSIVVNALMHSSYSNEINKEIEDYEKLEFLGDTLLQLIVTEELIKLYPNEKEGSLSKLRSTIVNEDTLCLAAQAIGLNSFVFLGKGEIKTGGRSRSALLADVFESLIASIYLDSDFDTAREITLNLLRNSVKDIFSIDKISFYDAKTRLQEFTLKRYQSLPIYETTQLSLENGPMFEVKLSLQGQKSFRGIDLSKKKAQQQAAALALEYVTNNNFLAPVETQE